jgi:hypothetical protein
MAVAKKEIIKLTTPVFRVAFPSVFEKAAFDGSAEKFSLTAIWTPKLFKGNEPELWKKMGAELQAQAKEVTGKDWLKLADDKKGLRKGTEKEDLEGFGEGTMFASLSTQRQPSVFDMSGNRILDAEEIYPGVFCRAVVNVYGYSNKSKGTAFGLWSLQKVKDGPRIDGGGSSGSVNDFEGDVDDSWLEEHTDNVDNNLDDGIPF